MEIEIGIYTLYWGRMLLLVLGSATMTLAVVGALYLPEFFCKKEE